MSKVVVADMPAASVALSVIVSLPVPPCEVWVFGVPLIVRVAELKDIQEGAFSSE